MFLSCTSCWCNIMKKRMRESKMTWEYPSRLYYPSATSRIIMTVKPIMKPMVARSVSRFVPLRASGMSSSTTTYIIAPAANASAKGRWVASV